MELFAGMHQRGLALNAISYCTASVHLEGQAASQGAGVPVEMQLRVWVPCGAELGAVKFENNFLVFVY